MQNTQFDIHNLQNSNSEAAPKPNLPKDFVNSEIAVEQLSKLKESGVILKNLHEYLFRRITTPLIVAMDENELYNLQNIKEVELTEADIKQFQDDNRRRLMSGNTLKFCINSLSIDPFVQCLVGHVENYPYIIDFSFGNQKVALKRWELGYSESGYNQMPEVIKTREYEVFYEVKFLQKNQEGQIEVEIVENPKSKK